VTRVEWEQESTRAAKDERRGPALVSYATRVKLGTKCTRAAKDPGGSKLKNLVKHVDLGV
jgi:hypothetical protein